VSSSSATGTAHRKAHRKAARTTMRMRAPSATGITSRRWRGFMPPS
jgi:hypothetical protein